MSLKQLLQHREHLKKIHKDTMSTINAQIAAAIRMRKVSCTSCAFRGVISDWTFVQTYYFSSEAQFYLDQWQKRPPEECLVICPICAHMTKVADHLYHTEFTETLSEKDIPPQRLFRKVLAKYGDRDIEPIEIELD